jgi:hypothetical protein
MPTLTQNTIRQIASHPEWTQLYRVSAALVRNPTTPVEISIRLLSQLTADDRQAVAADPQVDEAIRWTARCLFEPPGPSRNRSE